MATVLAVAGYISLFAAGALAIAGLVRYPTLDGPQHLPLAETRWRGTNRAGLTSEGGAGTNPILLLSNGASPQPDEA